MLKGKARKARKPPRGDTQQIRTAGITRMAGAIEITKIDGVPDTLIGTLEEVIGAWFASVRAILVWTNFSSIWKNYSPYLPNLELTTLASRAAAEPVR